MGFEYCNHEGTEEDPCECKFKEKEFKLSEEIQDRSYSDQEKDSDRVISIEDVKEFIRQDSKLIVEYQLGRITDVELAEKRKRLAGEELSK